MILSGLALLISGCGGVAPSGQAQTGVVAGGGEAVKPAALAPMIADQNRDADERLHLRTRVFLNDKTEVAEFYEPAPGQVLFSMAGRPSGAPSFTYRDVAGRSVREIWQLVSPDAALPTALQAVATVAVGDASGTAIGHASNAALDDASKVALAHSSIVDPSTAASGNGSAVAGAAGPASNATRGEGVRPLLTSGYCGTQWLRDFPCPNGDRYDWCTWDNNSYQYYYVNNGYQYYYNVCSEIGSVTLSASGDTGGNWTVPENTYRWFSWHANTHNCWANCIFPWQTCSNGCNCGCAWSPTVNQTASVTPNGNAVFNFEGSLNWN
jgi:hypothetical protein